MDRKTLFTLLLFSLLATGLVQVSGASIATWQQTYTVGYATAVVQTSDDGYGLCGSANGNFSLVKVDSLGEVEWSNIYDVKGTLGATDLVQTTDGGFALAGGGQDFLLVKTDANGNIEWSRSYGGAEEQTARALVQTEDGGYALAGLSITRLGPVGSGAGVSLDFWLVKTDSEGNMLWSQTYDSGDKDYAYDLVQTSDGGYAIAGSGLGLVKTDSKGNMEWNVVYGVPQVNTYIAPPDYPRALIQTNDGGYAILGGSYWLVKTDALGGKVWKKTFEGKLARSLVEVSDGYVFCGEYYPEVWEPTFRIIKTDFSGNEIWQRDFGGKGFCVIQTSDDGLAAAGAHTSSKSYLLKIDETGLILAQETATPSPSPTTAPIEQALYVVSTVVTLFFFALLAVFLIKYSKRKESNGSKTTPATDAHPNLLNKR